MYINKKTWNRQQTHTVYGLKKKGVRKRNEIINEQKKNGIK